MSDFTGLEKLKYNTLKLYAGDKVVPVSNADRVRNAIYDAALGVGAGMLMRKGMSSLAKNKKPIVQKFVKFMDLKPTFNPMSIGMDAAFGTIYGLTRQDLKNSIVKYNQNKSPENLQDLKKRLSPINLEKTSSFWGSAIRGVIPASRFAWKGIKTLGYGMLPMGSGRLGQWGQRMAGRSTAFPISHRAFGTAVKGTAAVGAYMGGKKIYDAVQSPKKDYTAFVRNNVLAGNIKPEELSYEDMVNVRSRGMK